MRVIDFFDRGVALCPDRTCVQDASVKRSFAQVQARTYRLGNALIDGGFPVETKAAVYSGNCAAALEAILGVMRAAGTLVTVNVRNAKEESASFLRQCDVEILFVHSACLVDLAYLQENCPRLRRIISLDMAILGFDYLEDLIASASEADPAIPEYPDRVATIFSTGGTTGTPKGAMWTDRTWEALIATLWSSMPADKPPVHLIVAPLSHAAGGVGIALLAGGATQIVLPGFDAGEVLQAIEREKATHLFLPPTAIYTLLNHPDVRRTDFSSLEYFLYAAAPMSVDRLKECLEVFGPVMAQSFGQAEAPMFCTFLSPREHVAAAGSARESILGSCGRPTLVTRVAIMDDEGQLLATGEQGEVVVKGSLVMHGYYRDPAETEKVSGHGWHHTGDVGAIDQWGYLHLISRKKDMIISGGFNIYPVEVEQVIWSHPAVHDCAVIGVPHEKWGEAVRAVVELKAGECASEEELILYCKERLGSVKAPKNVEFWPSLPRSAVGKVLKKDIRERFWKERERAI